MRVSPPPIHQTTSKTRFWGRKPEDFAKKHKKVALCDILFILYNYDVDCKNDCDDKDSIWGDGMNERLPTAAPNCGREREVILDGQIERTSNYSEMSR
jgi:hypothetical protein